MKRALLLLLSAITLLSACKKDDIAKKNEYEDSYKKFIDFKASVSNSYTYTVTSGSFFGVSSETIITVSKGEVVGRSYKFYRRANDNSNTNILVTSWEENSDNIGGHNEGAEPLNLDQVYDKAKNIWLKADTKTNTVIFETNPNGLIANCGYVPIGCQDDCFTGITISAIQAAPQVVLN